MDRGNSRPRGLNTRHSLQRRRWQWRLHNQAGNGNPITGGTNNPTLFLSTTQGFSVANGTSLPSLNLNRVFILTTNRTCSASESVINGLRGIDVEVVLIGSATCGKPYGFYPTSNCGETYYTIQFQGENDKAFGEYSAGFAPQNAPSNGSVAISGCQVTDDLDYQLGDTNEPLLAAALQYRIDSSCPAPSATTVQQMSFADAKADFNSGVGLDIRQPAVNELNLDLSTPTISWEQGR